jgi:hypothetical protein
LDQLEWIIDDYNIPIRRGHRLWGLHKNLASILGSLLQILNLVDPKPKNRDNTLLPQTPLRPHRKFINPPRHEHHLLLFEEKLLARMVLQEVRQDIVGMGALRQGIMHKHIGGIIHSLRMFDIAMVGCCLFLSPS